MSQVTECMQKLAEIGGDGNNDSFELAFSNLAHAYAHESSPTLEQYELGFQMLERSDDGKRAAGITGFQIGDQLIYAPVFWLRGKIKGHELMFLHEHDMFVPNKESWINEMLQKRMPRIGESVNRNPRQLGIRHPDLQRMSRTPYKTAGYYGPDATVEQILKQAAVKPVQHQETLLIDFLKVAGLAGFLAFNDLALHAPTIASAAHQLHGDALLDALSEAARAQPLVKQAAKPKLADPKKQPGVRIRVLPPDKTDEIPIELADTDREKLLRDGVLIHDDRNDTEVSRAYGEESAVQLFNPTTAGIYDVVLRSGVPTKCLVLFNPRTLSRHNSGAALVVSLADERLTKICDRDKVWATVEHPNEEFLKFVSGLPGVTALEDDGQLVALTAAGSCSAPLRIRKHLGTENGVDAYEIDGSHCGYDNQLVVDDSGATGFRCLDGKLFIPNTAKKLVVGSYYDSLDLGRASDLKNSIGRSLSKLAVYRCGNEVKISTVAGQSDVLTPCEGLAQLVLHHGLREGAARELLKQADAHRKASCLIKYAEPYLRDVQQFGPVSDLDEAEGTWTMRSGDAVSQQETQRVRSPVEMPEEEQRVTPEVNYLDGGMDIAQQAAQSGQKDVFDASVLTTMLRNMRDDQLIDRFIPALSRAMDASGRLLFQFYWHQEDFADRFGDRDLPELEDAIRNQFEGLGDLVVKLKQKSVNPDLGPGELGVSLNDLAGAS